MKNGCYIVRDREAGNEIERLDTLEEAFKEVAQFEKEDTENGTYTPDYYEIVGACPDCGDPTGVVYSKVGDCIESTCLCGYRFDF